MDRERVDQLLVVIQRRQPDLRRVRVLKHVMTEFVREIEAASPGLQRAVDDCHAQISHRHIRGIAARPAEVKREREQTSALRECLKAQQRSLRHTELLPQLHSGVLGCLNGRRRIQRNPRDLWGLALVDQKVDIASDPLNPRIKHPRPPTDIRVGPRTSPPLWDLIEQAAQRWPDQPMLVSRQGDRATFGEYRDRPTAPG